VAWISQLGFGRAWAIRGPRSQATRRLISPAAGVIVGQPGDSSRSSRRPRPAKSPGCEARDPFRQLHAPWRCEGAGSDARRHGAGRRTGRVREIHADGPLVSDGAARDRSEGGGILNHANATLNKTVVSGNTALDDSSGDMGLGGGIANLNFGVPGAPAPTLLINNSTITNNSVSDDVLAAGSPTSTSAEPPARSRSSTPSSTSTT
jgi:hypothetical protein